MTDSGREARHEIGRAIYRGTHASSNSAAEQEAIQHGEAWASMQAHREETAAPDVTRNHVATLLKDPFTRLYGAECSCGWRYTGLFPMDEWDKHVNEAAT
jgi:hypothetical protein